MKCPRCKSSNISIWKDGRKYCKDCKYGWVKGIRNTYKGKIECPDCGSFNIRKKEKDKRNGKRKWMCNECGAVWTEKSNVKVRPVEKKVWLKWIREEIQKGTDIKQIKEYIKDVTGVKDRQANHLIQQAIGKRKKVITEKEIEKAIYWRKQGLKWKDIGRLIGFSAKSIYNKVKYKYGVEV